MLVPMGIIHDPYAKSTNHIACDVNIATTNQSTNHRRWGGEVWRQSLVPSRHRLIAQHTLTSSPFWLVDVWMCGWVIRKGRRNGTGKISTILEIVWCLGGGWKWTCNVFCRATLHGWRHRNSRKYEGVKDMVKYNMGRRGGARKKLRNLCSKIFNDQNKHPPTHFYSISAFFSTRFQPPTH